MKTQEQFFFIHMKLKNKGYPTTKKANTKIQNKKPKNTKQSKSVFIG